MDDWKLIKGCPGLMTDWYNLTDFNPDTNQIDFGESLSISNDAPSCVNKHGLNSFYFLFNLKGKKIKL